jgi:ATP-binding protein involved in chromosome partitioning
MSQDTEFLVLEILKPVTHPGTKKSIVHSISKIIIRNNVVFFTIYNDNLTIEELEILKATCLSKLNERCDFDKIAITLSQRTQADKHLETTKQPKTKYKIPNANKVILVASGKGGVGKSTIALNLAISLSEQGYKTGLVDADIHGPSLPILAGLKHKPVLEDQYMLPLEKFGLDLMSVGFLIPDDNALIWRGPITTKMLYQLMMMTKWGNSKHPLDYLIIDTPPGTGDVHLSLVENFDLNGVVIIATPQELALADVKKGIQMFTKLGVPIIGIIENMSFFEDPSGQKHYIFGSGGGIKLAKELKIKLLAELPISADLMKASDTGKPLAFYNPNHPISKALEKVTKEIQNY